jgi:hypothetical protein
MPSRARRVSDAIGRACGAGCLGLLALADPACTTVLPPEPTPAFFVQPREVTGACGTSPGPVVVHHVIWIWMENHDYVDIIGSSSSPYVNELALLCGLATNYNTIAKPSLPNYIAAASGSTQGIADNDSPSAHRLTVPSIFSQVKDAGMQWRSYQESAPRNCPSESAGLYAVRHDPAPYFTNLAADCVNWDVPMGTTTSGAFLADLNAGALPAFSFITPNLCNNTHDCPILTGDQWLASWIPKIVTAPNYKSGHTVIFLTWDEGVATSHVPAIVISPFTRWGASSSARFDHYSLLRTTEELLGVPVGLGNAASAASMRAAFFSGGTSVQPDRR